MFFLILGLKNAGGQHVLSPYHAMGCNPVSMVDPLGLRAGMFPETHGAGGPTQMDIALMTPPTILLDRMYGFGNDPWTMMNRGALNDYEAKMAGQQRLIEAVSGLLAVRRYNYHLGLEKQRLQEQSLAISKYFVGFFNKQARPGYLPDDENPNANSLDNPDPDPLPGGGLPREGGNINPKSFNFTQSTSATYEAGVSGMFFVANVQGMSPFGGFSKQFNFQTLYVQFPSSTKDGRKFSRLEAATISAEAFNDAAKSVAIKLKFYTSVQASLLTGREIQDMITAAATFYINHHIKAGATITNRPFGKNTIVTPAIWGK